MCVCLWWSANLLYRLQSCIAWDFCPFLFPWNKWAFKSITWFHLGALCICSQIHPNFCLVAVDLEMMAKQKTRGEAMEQWEKGQKGEIFQGKILGMLWWKHQASYSFPRLNGSLIQTDFCTKINVLIIIMKNNRDYSDGTRNSFFQYRARTLGPS